MPNPGKTQGEIIIQTPISGLPANGQVSRIRFYRLYLRERAVIYF